MGIDDFAIKNINTEIYFRFEDDGAGLRRMSKTVTRNIMAFKALLDRRASNLPGIAKRIVPEERVKAEDIVLESLGKFSEENIEATISAARDDYGLLVKAFDGKTDRDYPIANFFFDDYNPELRRLPLHDIQEISPEYGCLTEEIGADEYYLELLEEDGKCVFIAEEPAFLMVFDLVFSGEDVVHKFLEQIYDEDWKKRLGDGPWLDSSEFALYKLRRVVLSGE